MSVTLMEGQSFNIPAQSVDQIRPYEAAAWLAAIVAFDGPLSLGDVDERRDRAGYVTVRIAQGRRVTV
jgi:hypothetical protein